MPLKKNILILVGLAVGLVIFMALWGVEGEPLSNATSFVLGMIAGISKDILRGDNHEEKPKKCNCQEEE